MDLLDDLAQLLRCNYLSDLHYAGFTDSQAQAIEEIPEDRFPLEDYRHAVEYLIGGTHAPFDDVPSAKAALIGALRGRKFP